MSSPPQASPAGDGLRVLYVTRQYPPHGVGGIGTYTEALAQMMSEAGHDVTVVSASPEHRRSSEQAGGVRVERFPVLGPRVLWEALHRASWVVASRLHAALSALVAVRRLGQRFDVIEGPEWKAEALLLRLARRGPVVVHLHLPQELVRRWDGVPLRRWRGGAIAERLERRTVRRADAVTATSSLSRTLPTGAWWLPDTAVDIVPPPIRPHDWRPSAPADASAPVVLFLGHLERRKAPEVLVEALGHLVEEVEGLRVVFAGRSFTTADGERYDARIRSVAERHGVACEVLPPQADRATVLELYGRARVVAVPSRYETLSMVALEAAACGRPVVMTDAVGAKEWLGPAAPELVVPVDDPLALAGALRPLLVDPQEARRRGEGQRAALVEACGVTSIVDGRTAVYRRVGRRTVPTDGFRC